MVCITPYIRAASPAVAVIAPLRSSDSLRRVCLLDNVIDASAIRTAPIGTLIRKTHRHERPVVMTPPASAPIIPPTPPAADQTPKALARVRFSVNLVLTTVNVAGAIIAAPTPCATRAATSICGAPARPPVRLDAVNKANPPTSIRRSPNRSVARPASNMNPATVIR